MKSIVINFAENGESTIEAIGFKGKACQNKTTEAIEKALGVVKSRTKKPEFYQDNQQQAKVGQ